MSTFGGIIIGVLVGGGIAVAWDSRSKKEIDRLKNNEQSLREELERVRRESTANSDSVPNADSHNGYVPAEIAFKNNLNVLSPLLKGVSKQEITNRQEWTESIVSINNKELTDLWMAANKRPDLWVTYLQTFGLQIDFVEQFEAASHHMELYDDVTGKELKIGQMYRVVSSCWIYTDDNNNKSVVCRGLASIL